MNGKKERIDIVQINLGDRCNLRCSHCHIAASPEGKKNMDYPTAERIIERLNRLNVKRIEFTGGSPELNPNLLRFIEWLSGDNRDLAVRTNLVVLALPAYSFYIEIYKRYGVKVIASLPDIFPDTTDRQRGNGVFHKSIDVLKRLNEIGYGRNGLSLDLVYNPVSDYLPPDKKGLEENYREVLKREHDIVFNNLITMVNSPIKRFREYLQTEGRLKDYLRLLKDNYNPVTTDKIMCRRLIGVDYEGYIYDCDFNLSLNMRVRGYEDKRLWEIAFEDFTPEITFDEHCYACMVNMGSSCHGILLKEEEMGFDVKEKVKSYYGKELQRTSDLKTDACCNNEAVPEYIKDALILINDEIKMKYYGCGSPIPLCIEGLKVIDIGCGTGRDTYVISRLAGKDGFVYGIDMTENQLDVARKYIKEQTGRFGYETPNVEFILDNMENLTSHFKEESIDLAISNCVINLSQDKEIVLNQVFKVLRWGGELYFSDVYADRRVSEDVRKDPLLFAECLGGALYYKDFIRIARRAEFPDPRLVSQREIEITNPKIRKLIGNLKFYSITYRLWKLRGLEDACEDYGHIAVYRGGIPFSPFRFELDGTHIFYRNKPERVCGNTALMLSQTRFGRYFDLIGGFDEHFGEFKECGTLEKNYNVDNTKNSGGCC